MQDAASNLEVYQYNASLNVFVGQPMGAVGAPWMFDGIAAAPLSGGGATATAGGWRRSGARSHDLAMVGWARHWVALSPS
jgi:hypothetical protein